MKSSWKKLHTKNLLSHPRLTVEEHTVELPDGTTTKYILYSEGSDYVTIIASDTTGRFALIHEYSYPHDSRMLQFPEGKCDPGEPVLDSASRELAEEISMTSSSMKVIGTSPKSHRRDKIMQYVVVAPNATPAIGNFHRDKEEHDIELVWHDATSINHLIATGKIVQKNTLAAWSIYTATQNTVIRPNPTPEK